MCFIVYAEIHIKIIIDGVCVGWIMNILLLYKAAQYVWWSIKRETCSSLCPACISIMRNASKHGWQTRRCFSFSNLFNFMLLLSVLCYITNILSFKGLLHLQKGGKPSLDPWMLALHGGNYSRCPLQKHLFFNFFFIIFWTLD